jgi:hypothetical protein
VRSIQNTLLIGGSIPPMANVLFSFSYFFFFAIFPKIAFIQHLSVRLRIELGSRLFFKCIIFN